MKRRPFGLRVLLLAMAAPLVLLPVAAHADPTGDDNAYAGAGRQWAQWSVAQKQLSLEASAYNSMPNTRCQDSFVDWKTSGGHYDSRVVRVCRPGDHLFSWDWSGPRADSAGDLFATDIVWNEPADAWDRRGIYDMKKGAGLEISDNYSNGTFQLFHSEKFQGAPGALSAYTDAIPRTCVEQYARVLTLYQDGHFTGCKNFPADDPND